MVQDVHAGECVTGSPQPMNILTYARDSISLRRSSMASAFFRHLNSLSLSLTLSSHSLVPSPLLWFHTFVFSPRLPGANAIPVLPPTRRFESANWRIFPCMLMFPTRRQEDAHEQYAHTCLRRFPTVFPNAGNISRDNRHTASSWSSHFVRFIGTAIRHVVK